MSDALFPVFDRNGKYLYFTASTDIALTAQGLDMSSNERRVSRSVYVVVLSKDEPSPITAAERRGKGSAEKRKDDRKNPRVGFGLSADYLRLQMTMPKAMRRRPRLRRRGQGEEKAEGRRQGEARRRAHRHSRASASAYSRCRFRRGTTWACRPASPAMLFISEGPDGASPKRTSTDLKQTLHKFDLEQAQGRQVRRRDQRLRRRRSTARSCCIARARSGTWPARMSRRRRRVRRSPGSGR